MGRWLWISTILATVAYQSNYEIVLDNIAGSATAVLTVGTETDTAQPGTSITTGSFPKGEYSWKLLIYRVDSGFFSTVLPTKVFRQSMHDHYIPQIGRRMSFPRP